MRAVVSSKDINDGCLMAEFVMADGHIDMVAGVVSVMEVVHYCCQGGFLRNLNLDCMQKESLVCLLGLQTKFHDLR